MKQRWKQDLNDVEFRLISDNEFGNSKYHKKYKNDFILEFGDLLKRVTRTVRVPINHPICIN